MLTNRINSVEQNGAAGSALNNHNWMKSGNTLIEQSLKLLHHIEKGWHSIRLNFFCPLFQMITRGIEMTAGL